MAKDPNSEMLTLEERKIAKYLHGIEISQQEISRILLMGRRRNFNFARISEIKSNAETQPATKREYSQFIWKRQNTSNRTWLNPIDHFHVLRSREAAARAIFAYNSPNSFFRVEQFSILMIVAWNQLFVEFAKRHGHIYLREDNPNRVMSFGALIGSDWCPVSDIQKSYLERLLEIRNKAEHMGLSIYGDQSHAMFQAIVWHYDDKLVEIGGSDSSLKLELGYALQLRAVDASQGVLDITDHTDEAGLMNEDPKFKLSTEITHKFVSANFKGQAEPTDPNFWKFNATTVCAMLVDKGWENFKIRSHSAAVKYYNHREADGQVKDHATSWVRRGPSKQYEYSSVWIDYLDGQFRQKGGYEYLKNE